MTFLNEPINQPDSPPEAQPDNPPGNPLERQPDHTVDHPTDEPPASPPASAAWPNTYTMQNPTFRYGLSIFLALVGLYVMSVSSPRYPHTALETVLGLAMIAGAAFMIYTVAVSRLTVGPDGLTYTDGLGTVTAGWDEVDKIARVASGRSGTTTVLVLTNGSKRIGVSQFGGVGPDSPLGADLREYAPRLFPDINA
jgi:hypothetical protein